MLLIFNRECTPSFGGKKELPKQLNIEQIKAWNKKIQLVVFFSSSTNHNATEGNFFCEQLNFEKVAAQIIRGDQKGVG